MSDAMQVAQQRRAGYQKAIAQKETEIAELKEHLEDLDNFLEFGESLMGNEPAAAASPTGRTVVSRPAVSRPIQPEKADAKKEVAGNIARSDGTTMSGARTMHQKRASHGFWLHAQANLHAPVFQRRAAHFAWPFLRVGSLDLTAGLRNKPGIGGHRLAFHIFNDVQSGARCSRRLCFPNVENRPKTPGNRGHRMRQTKGNDPCLRS